MVKNLPEDSYLEKTLIGIALIDEKNAFNIVTALDTADFTADNRKNSIIFNAMVTLVKKGSTLDVTSVATQLIDENNFERVGGAEYLQECIDCATTLSSTEQYIAALKDKSMLRKLFLAVDKLETEYNKGINDIPDYIAKYERTVNDITGLRRSSDFSSARELAPIIGAQLQAMHGNSEETISGLTTGFRNLDLKINGLERGDLIIVAARPSVGKSALTLNIAYNAAKKTNKPVAIFSLEMNKEIIMKRLIACESKVELGHIIKGFLSKDEKVSIHDAVGVIGKTKIFIEDNGGTTMDDIFLKCKKLKEQFNDLGLIVVDYIGLIKEGSRRFESDQVKIQTFSQELKQLAGELDVPVICVAQINRSGEKDGSRLPQMSNLRQSGSMEADADKVILLHRDSYYTDQGLSPKRGTRKKDKSIITGHPEGSINDMEEKARRVGPNNADIMSVIVAKNRNGQQGMCNLFFFKECGKFDTPSLEQEEEISNYSISDFNED